MATCATVEDEWENATYYFGSWEDGSMKTGWQKITVYDDSTDKKDDLITGSTSNPTVRNVLIAVTI